MENCLIRNLNKSKLKSIIKISTEVTLKISLNVACDSNDENSFLPKLLFTKTQVLRLRKGFNRFKY